MSPSAGDSGPALLNGVSGGQTILAAGPMGGPQRNAVRLAVALIVLFVPLASWSLATRAHVNPWPWIVGLPLVSLGLLAAYEVATRRARVVIGPEVIQVDWFLTRRRIQRAEIARLVSTVRITPQGIRVPTLILVARDGCGLGNLLDRFDWNALAATLGLGIDEPPIEGSLDDLESQFPGALMSASTLRVTVVITVLILVVLAAIAVWAVSTAPR